MGDGEADDLVFHVLERSHLPLWIEEVERSRRDRWRAHVGQRDRRRRALERGKLLFEYGRERLAATRVTRLPLKLAIAGELRLDLGKLANADLIALGEHDGTEYRVLELADIAGPRIGAQQLERIGRNGADALALLGAEAREEMPYQVGNILGMIGERRYGDREHMQPIE